MSSVQFMIRVNAKAAGLLQRHKRSQAHWQSNRIEVLTISQFQCSTSLTVTSTTRVAQEGSCGTRTDTLE